jgi:hypothetical protein
MSTRFNYQLPARPESGAAVLKVLSQNDELMVKDIARLGRLAQSQARVALEELVTSGTVVVRTLRRRAKPSVRWQYIADLQRAIPFQITDHV